MASLLVLLDRQMVQMMYKIGLGVDRVRRNGVGRSQGQKMKRGDRKGREEVSM